MCKTFVMFLLRRWWFIPIFVSWFIVLTITDVAVTFFLTEYFGKILGVCRHKHRIQLNRLAPLSQYQIQLFESVSDRHTIPETRDYFHY